jgi:cytochrome c6
MPMKRTSIAGIATLVSLALVAAAIASPASVPGNPAAGKRIFLTNPIPCGMCHTLKAASTYGTRGPNLDKVKPGYATAVRFITNGARHTARYPTGMPAFGDALSKKQIRNLAAFIYTSTH